MFGVDGFVGELIGVGSDFGIVVILGSLSEFMFEGKSVLLDGEFVWLSSTRTGISSRSWRVTSSMLALLSVSFW